MQSSQSSQNVNHVTKAILVLICHDNIHIYKIFILNLECENYKATIYFSKSDLKASFFNIGAII